MKGFVVIPALLHERIVKQGRISWNSDILQFVEPYKEDLPNFNCLKSEMDIGGGGGGGGRDVLDTKVCQ